MLRAAARARSRAASAASTGVHSGTPVRAASSGPQPSIGAAPRGVRAEHAAAARAAWRQPRGSPASSTGGACSRMTWALVPLMPNEDTRGPARPVGRRARAGLRSAARPRRPTSRRAGSAASTCRVRGSMPCRIARTILMTPATPAAAWVWPMLDFTEPSHSGGSRCGPGRRWPAAPAPRSGRRAWCRCRAPRPRRRRRRRGRRRPAPARITRCWAGPLGAVSPLEAPSWLTAVPRTTASTGWPLRLRVGQPLQQQHADALGPAGAVGVGGERLAPAVRGAARAAG